ncbi:cytochrome P450 [Micromonospora mangrovi]|uniref:Cytochrome P450 n=2 Tax=Micromonospora TaxID=1873 RepID=A0AAU8HE52_9ACTN
MTSTGPDVIGRLTERYDHLDAEFVPEVAEVVNGRLRDGAGITRTEAYGGMWIVSRYALVRAVLKDHETFSSAQGVFVPRAPGVPKFSPIDHDPPEQKELRRMMAPPMLPDRIHALAPDVRRLAAELVGALADRGGGDVAEELARPMAIGVLALAIGLSEKAQHEIRELTTTLWRQLATAPDSSAFWPAFAELLSAEVEHARRSPGETYLAQLARRPIPEETLHSIIVSYCVAGHETTMNTISRLLWHLARHPETQQRLRAEPESRSVAADETLRRWCPTDRFTRVATREVTLGDTVLPAGARVMLLIDAANRDPRRFPDPDTFSLDRGNSHQHLSFGLGIHACMGSGLARLELRAVLDELAGHGDYRLAGEPRRRFENGRHIVFEDLRVTFGQ